jgi:hypothetical protein
MNKTKKLAALFTGTAAVLMLTGTSAFAEERHRAETRDQAQPQVQRLDTSRSDSNQRRDTQRSDSRSSNRSSSQAGTYERRSIDQSANQSHSYDRRSNNQSYNDSRSRSYQRQTVQQYRGSYDRAPVRNESRYYSGRVSRVERFGGGFRVWVGGAPYPFFVSAERWSRFPIRIGLNIRLGGYWDPIGYYNVYDVGPYAYSTSGDVHGVVESVDYRRGTAVLRDDVSGSFITVLMRGNDPRLGDLRTGDYVDLSGAWNRSGVFDAFNVADLRPAGNGRYDDGYGRPDGY